MAGAHVPAVGDIRDRNWASIASWNISRRQKTNTLHWGYGLKMKQGVEAH